MIVWIFIAYAKQSEEMRNLLDFPWYNFLVSNTDIFNCSAGNWLTENKVDRFIGYSVILWSLYYSSCGPICNNIYWTIKWTETIFSNIRSSASERIKQVFSFMYYGNLNIPVWLFTAYKDEFCCLQGQDVDCIWAPEFQ